tara:strand:- start:2495 stop:2758 length:264 start_codon:yes stop_codon:yes gene_type:complete
MTWNFEKLVVGGTPTFLEAEFANEVLGVLNALANWSIEKGESDQILVSDDGIKVIYKFPPTGWEEKTITLCESGVSVDYTFLVKSAT